MLFSAEADLSAMDDSVLVLKNEKVLQGFFSPIQGKVISPFGYRGKRLHAGSDIKLHRGDTVRAAFCGLVTKACVYSGYGNLVIIKHLDAIETYYGHLSKCMVHKGDSVFAGQVVGLGGRTGRATTDHLHFEVRFNHIAKNPEKYFNFNVGEVKDAFKDKMLANTPVVKQEPQNTITEVLPASIELSNSTEAPILEECVTIIKGDTLYSLAKRYNTTVTQLQALNGMENTKLKIGLKLKVR